jgi:hypothetical protein
MAIELINTEMENTFQNIGEMLECDFINSKFNYHSNKIIDFHLINYSSTSYVNLGDLVTAEEVNNIINNQ